MQQPIPKLRTINSCDIHFPSNCFWLKNKKEDVQNQLKLVTKFKKIIICSFGITKIEMKSQRGLDLSVTYLCVQKSAWGTSIQIEELVETRSCIDFVLDFQFHRNLQSLRNLIFDVSFYPDSTRYSTRLSQIWHWTSDFDPDLSDLEDDLGSLNLVTFCPHWPKELTFSALTFLTAKKEIQIIIIDNSQTFFNYFVR